MFPVHGLHGHIARNNALSLGLLSLFVVAVCALWCVTAIWVLIAALLIGAIMLVAGNPHLILLSVDLLARPTFVFEHMYVPLLVSAIVLAVGLTFLRRIIGTLTGARNANRLLEPTLYNTVENLSLAAGVPMPRIDIIETSDMNAYATGLSPHYATIAVTRGLLNTLTPKELEAVLAHEVSHIKNQDTRVMAIAALFGGLISKVSETLWSRYLIRSASLNDTFQVRGDAAEGRTTAREQYRRLGLMFAFIAMVIVGPLMLLAVDAATENKGQFRGLKVLLFVTWLAATVWIGFKDHLLAVLRKDLKSSSLKPLSTGLVCIVVLAVMWFVRAPGHYTSGGKPALAAQAQCEGLALSCRLAAMPRGLRNWIQQEEIDSSARKLNLFGEERKHFVEQASARPWTPSHQARVFADIILPLIAGFSICIFLINVEAAAPTKEYNRYWTEQREVLKYDRGAPLKPQTEYVMLLPLWLLNLLSGAVLVVIYAAAALLQGAVTRPREYMADAGALELIKDPQPLVTALRRIGRQDNSGSVPAAFLATLICGPSIGWLATHPEIEDRVSALRTFGTGREAAGEIAPQRRLQPRAVVSAAPVSPAPVSQSPVSQTPVRPARPPRIVQGLKGGMQTSRTTG